MVLEEIEVEDIVGSGVIVGVKVVLSDNLEGRLNVVTKVDVELIVLATVACSECTDKSVVSPGVR